VGTFGGFIGGVAILLFVGLCIYWFPRWGKWSAETKKNHDGDEKAAEEGEGEGKDGWDKPELHSEPLAAGRMPGPPMELDGNPIRGELEVPPFIGEMASSPLHSELHAMPLCSELDGEWRRSRYELDVVVILGEGGFRSVSPEELFAEMEVGRL
jgi:hypothetical protein